MTSPIPPTASASTGSPATAESALKGTTKTGQGDVGSQPNADRAPSPTRDAADPSFRSTPPPKAREDGSHRSVQNRTGARTSAVTSTPNK